MNKMRKERRKHARYDTEVKIYFQVTYDLKTKVKFQVFDKKNNKILSKKYSAFSKNVSAEGLCFISEKKLKKGDWLLLELYVPSTSEPIFMEGEVVWSHKVSLNKTLKMTNALAKGKQVAIYESGVKLFSVNNQDVQGSLYFDHNFQVEWSAVLESILGKYSDAVKKS